jgi:hypothetical protein
LHGDDAGFLGFNTCNYGGFGSEYDVLSGLTSFFVARFFACVFIDVAGCIFAVATANQADGN